MRSIMHRTLVIGLLPLLLAACPTAPRDAAHSGEVLDRAFAQGAAEQAVPEPLLKAVAWEESRWFDAGKANLVGGWGLMNLREGESLDEAARLTGLTLEELRRDPAANIAGGAALLRSKADWYFTEYPNRDPERLADWFEVVKHHSGFLDAQLAELYAAGVFRTLERGAARLFPDGHRIELAPTPVDYGRDLIFGRQSWYLTPDYPQATWTPSPNFGDRAGTAIDLVLIRTCGGNYTSCIQTFASETPGVSGHYVVSATGAVTQMVENANMAYHSGTTLNPRSIAVYHEGEVTDSANYTAAMYDASAALTRWLCDTLSIPKDRTHIMGRDELSTTQLDPGQYWDWDHYMSLVNPTTQTDGQIIGFVFWGTDFNTDLQNPARRIEGATVTLDTGASDISAADGRYEFTVPAGTYTVTAAAAGYVTETKTVDVVADAIAWGSIMLTESVTNPEPGTLRAKVFWGERAEDFAANKDDPSKIVAGATVTFSPGNTTAVTGADGWCEKTLDAGDYTLTASAPGYLDGARNDAIPVFGNQTSTTEVMVLKEVVEPGDTDPPVVTITRPTNGSVVTSAQVQVAGNLSDASSIAGVTVNGAAAQHTQANFNLIVELQPGANTLTVEAEDSAGNTGSAEVTVTYETGAPSGIDGFVYDASADESARIAGALVQVASGDGLQALTDATGAFSLDAPAGVWAVTVTAEGFRAATSSLTVRADERTEVSLGLQPGTEEPTDADEIEIGFPADGAVLFEPEVIVSGTALVEGLSRVTVNGVEADLGDVPGSFTATVVLAQEGANAIEAVAFDAEGAEAARTMIIVSYEAAGCGCAAQGGGSPGAGVLLLGLMALAWRSRRRR